MGQVMAQISSEYVRKSSFRLSTKNAWAKWARNRWPNNAVKELMARYKLTEGLAKGIVYAQASQAAIDAVLDAAAKERPLGDFELGLEILAIRTATKLEDYIAHKAQEARHERIEWAQRERARAAQLAVISGRGLEDRLDADPRGPAGSLDAGLGQPTEEPPVERSFAPGDRP